MGIRASVTLLFATIICGNIKSQAMEIIPQDDIYVTFVQQLKLMEDGNTESLGAQLDDHFILIHITGYRQMKNEWLSQMKDNKFIYHNITIDDVRSEVNGNRARVVGRMIADATVYGSRNTWRLQLAQEYEWREKGWIALNSTANLW